MAFLAAERTSINRVRALRGLPKEPGELYTVRNLPVIQNRMFESREDARGCARGDVELVRDRRSGLIVNQAFRAELLEYDAHYQNEQAHSAVFRGHLEKVADIIDAHFHGRSLIEVGCGKGHFLEQLQRRGYRINGVDPAYEGSNPAVVRQLFAPHLDLRADGIVLRHILEHVRDPAEFLGAIREANGGRGKVYIEVPCFDWICAQRAWFDVFYEHVNYFRIGDFLRMFDAVHEAGHVFGGQYLYVVADLQGLRRPSRGSPEDCDFPCDFLAGVTRHAKRIKAQRGQCSAIWGGASKGVIFALFMERAGATIDLVIDTNPAKQGKYLPGTGLKVHSPREALERLPPRSKIIVMNGNYLSEIRDLTENRFHYLAADHEFI